MARKKITVIELTSDFTGKEIPPDEAVKITISFADKKRRNVVVDAAEGDVADLIARGREAGRRSGGSRRARRSDSDE